MREESKIRKLWRLFVIDKAVRYSLLSRVASIGLGPLLVISIGAFLHPEEQGVYYVFASLMQLRIFIDLGFSVSAVQLLSHSFGGLKLNKASGIEGDPEASRQYLDLCLFVSKFYLLLGALTLAGIGLAGHWYLSHTLAGYDIAWIGPWWTMVGSLSVGMCTLGLLTIADSSNLLAITNKWRFFAELAAIGSFLGVLWFGGGLWASAAMVAFRSAVSIGPLAIELGRPFLGQILASTGKSVQYRTLVLPLQLKNMVTQTMGFLIFYVYTPMSLSLAGAVTAGIVGMSLQLSNMVHSFSSIWFNTKIPLMGNLAGQGQIDQLNDLHRKGMVSAVLSWIVTSFGVLAVAILVKVIWPEFGSRFGGALELVIFFMGSAGYLWIHTRTAYIRAHRLELFAPLSIFLGIITVLLLGFLLPAHGVLGAAIAYAGVMAIGSIWVEVVYRSFKSKMLEPGPALKPSSSV